jgi:hypothetical protein
MRWRYHGAIIAVVGEDENKTKLRPENESSRSYYEIWHVGRLHMS